MEPREERGKKDVPGKPAYWALGAIAIALCLVVAGSVGVWHVKHRHALNERFKANIEFVAAPKTVPSGQASKFVVHVEQKKKEIPLPGRVMDIRVSPPNKARILAITGAPGENYREGGSHAKGKTDSNGDLAMVVQATEPGKYTLVALDSTSNREGTVNFEVRTN